MKIKLASQKGQAMVEMAIVMPLLITLLLATGYFGHIVAAQQSLNMAARSAARSMAIESSSSENYRILGSYSATASVFEEKAEAAIQGILGPSQLSSRSSTRLNHNYNDLKFGHLGRFERISEHRFVYRMQENFDLLASFSEARDRKGNLPLNLKEPLKYGLGAVFYGGTLQYDLDELNPLARFIFRRTDDPTIRIGVTSLMPAELPLRGRGYGLLDLNPWIANIVTQSVSATVVGADGPEAIYPSLF